MSPSCFLLSGVLPLMGALPAGAGDHSFDGLNAMAERLHRSGEPSNMARMKPGALLEGGLHGMLPWTSYTEYHPPKRQVHCFGGQHFGGPALGPFPRAWPFCMALRCFGYSCMCPSMVLRPSVPVPLSSRKGHQANDGWQSAVQVPPFLGCVPQGCAVCAMTHCFAPSAP